MSEIGYVKIATAQTVQDFPNAVSNSGKLKFGGMTRRTSLLSPWGNRDREVQLRQLYHHDYNTIFKSAIAGMIKKIQSTPFEIKAPRIYGDYWQKLLMNADFKGWSTFLSKIIVDYSRHDIGAFIEIIGPGDPLGPLTGAPTGIACLDAMRCWPTGDPLFPVVYFDIDNEMHIMHRDRVVQLVDTPDSDSDVYGNGTCALSRCVAPVTRQILMSRYVEQYLDDKPPPGFAIFTNLNDEDVEAAMANMKETRLLEEDEWGRTVKLFGLQTEIKPSVEYITFSAAPEGFDFEKFTNLDVKEIALGIGLDVQEIWELTGGNLGTATQSEVLAQKSRGKAIGRLLKEIERVINSVFPAEVVFEFKYEDSQEDIDRANIAQAWASTVSSMTEDLTQQERRQLYANQIEAVRDVLTDQDGGITRLGDSDPISAEQSNRTDVNESIEQAPDEGETPTQASDYKAFSDTRKEFIDRFKLIADAAQDRIISLGAVRMAFQQQLMELGRKAFIDGLEDGGVEVKRLDSKQEDELKKWIIKQSSFVVKFIREALTTKMSDNQIGSRADAWANRSLGEIYYKGLAAADRDSLYKWVVHVSKEHCKTCLKLNGQIHKLSTYVERGLLPRSNRLVCTGLHCGCSLKKMKGGKARGRIRSVPYVRH